MIRRLLPQTAVHGVRRGILALGLLMLIGLLTPLRLGRQHDSQQTGAIAAIRTLHTAQVEFYSRYGRYAASLTELGPPPSGAASPSAADLISNDLAVGEKSGYKLALTATPDGYAINADPVAFNSRAGRTFYSDQTLVIRENLGWEPATSNSQELR
jgi:type IV pilus assembly protein PilA